MSNGFGPSDLRNVVNIAKRQPLLVRHLGHMRQRHADQRLGFVVGAGISEEAGVPLWRDLSKRLSKFYSPDGPPAVYAGSNYSATLVAQFIFNRFKAAETKKPIPIDPRLVSVAVRDAWYRRIYYTMRFIKTYQACPRCLQFTHT
jgi:hypothetical protein